MPRRSWQSFRMAPRCSSGGEDGGADPRLLDVVDAHHVGHIGRVVELHDRAIGEVELVDHAGCGGDQVEVELAPPAAPG